MLARVPSKWTRGLLVISSLLCSLTIVAADKPIQSYRLELKKMKGVEHGKTAVVKGQAGATPHRFFVDGLNMNMPVTVLARPVRASDEVDVRVSKYSWNQALREGTAAGEPLAFKFRTEGEFQVAVSSDKPDTPYRLLVWVGDEFKPELRPVVVKASEFKTEGSGISPVMWVIAIALLAIVALLGVLVLRRKAS